MTSARKNTLLLSAIIAGLASLPMTWVHVIVLAPEEDAEIHEPEGLDDLAEQILMASVLGMEFDVSGLRGEIPELYDFPFWGTIAVAAIAGLAQLLNRTDSFDVPLIIQWLLALAGFVTISLPVVSGLSSSIEVAPRL